MVKATFRNFSVWGESRQWGDASELDFYDWNGNSPMKCKAKMAVHGRQFCTSGELNFHIWNANSQINSQSFARVKSEAKMAAHGGKFNKSVSVLFAVFYVSSSPLKDFSL